MNGMRRHASALIQGALVLALIALLVLLVSNLLANMKMRGIQTGLDFLLEPVGFDISESWLTHTAEDPFWHAFLVGLINTLRVAVPGIVLATFIGLLVAVARISHHPLARALAHTYIEVLRNVPLLIQLLMGYIALIEGIVMGGGVGISLHGDVRVAAESYSFAMPETGIDFFPDVGATYALPRLPGCTGRYLALTGARIGAGDALAVGLARSEEHTSELQSH